VNPPDRDEDYRYIAGVRFRDSSPLAFFTVDNPAIETGTWVLVTTSRGQEAARVVVSPYQVVIHPFDVDVPSKDSVLAAGDVEGIRIPQEKPRGNRHEGGRLLGGLGNSGRSAGFPNTFSEEDAQYRMVKRALPQLGQRVAIGGEHGTVVSLQVFKRLVTIRYDNSEREGTYSTEMLDGSVLPDDDFN